MKPKVAASFGFVRDECLQGSQHTPSALRCATGSRGLSVLLSAALRAAKVMLYKFNCLQTTPSANFQRTFCYLELPSPFLFRSSGTSPTLLFADTELLPPISPCNSAYYGGATGYGEAKDA